MEILFDAWFSIGAAIDLWATIEAIKEGDIFWSILGLVGTVFLLSLVFGPHIENFIKEIRAEDDDDTSMRSAGMTHSKFEQWLEDTCADAPNHTIKYSGCSGTRNGNWFNYRFEFRRGEWIYGYNGEAKVTFYKPPLEYEKDTWFSTRLRNDELLKENFFSTFKDGLALTLSDAKEDYYEWFKGLGPAHCKDRFLSASEKQKIYDDAEHFHQEVNEDLEYVSSAFGRLCNHLFGEEGEAQKSENDTCSAKSEKKCEVPVVKDAVQPLVKAAVKAKAVASYQSKMDRLVKQYKDYDTELRNLGTETTNYKKCMDAIQSELNRQCEYVARIAEIERKQTDITDNPKAAEISKKVRDSYKAKRKEAESNIASLIDRAEQVIVLMQQDLENHIYDAKAQVETGKIDDMLSKLENSVQLDQEINGKAAKICLELKGIEPKTENEG